MLLKLNAKTLNSIKAKAPIEPLYTLDEISDIITVNMEAPDIEDIDYPDEVVTYIEDIDEELREVNMFDVEDMI